MNPTQEQTSSPFRFYVIGFILCLLLTFTSYLIVSNHLLPRLPLLFILAGLALLQAFVQLFFFLHVGRESNPKWHTWAFFSMVSVLVILTVGSIWIMYNLNYRMMPPHA
ncbi:MAG: cytochrome C oxidase subunit IV family protein [Chlamydiota bacterium]